MPDNMVVSHSELTLIGSALVNARHVVAVLNEMLNADIAGSWERQLSKPLSEVIMS
jgi:hypothetical protein